ncbi:DUF6807 family protein [Allostreptomyces psammosilenae]|uniref:Putative dehydrogenase n=1 Tax=Allostreptomyces psammosilenae TaxID=1892865 RepID=A0A852ZLD4_9ACTN|nr:DUF6807 family protein [Allostreptomyces psammosilenae]NYI03203.1 putative dehydrogenase [Allostreptomyces psammosilenae]
MDATRIALVGAHGHGRWHLRNLREPAAAGRADLVAVCDLVPVQDDLLDGLGPTPPRQGADLGALLRQTRPEITIIATPIPTHVDLALTALAAGSHVLLEKPTAATLAEYRRLVEGVDASGLACQIGFQSLGSTAVETTRRLIAEGAMGRVTGIGAAGAWSRDAAYYSRARWAGRRRIDGVDVVDGVLTNPLAHAVATALAVDGSEGEDDVRDIELELFHANPIESDDTSALRLTTARGTTLTVTATLCADRRHEPYVLVHGERGRITLWYTLDQVRLDLGDGSSTTYSGGRTDLLENLIGHVRAGEELLVPPRRTGAFTRVLEAVRTAPDPLPIPQRYVRTVPAEDGTERRELDGAAELAACGADRLALLSELGVPWARRDQGTDPDRRGDGVVTLTVGERPVADYVTAWPAHLPARLSPRPFWHPVRTLAGTAVTEFMPVDHLHHLGASLAVPDVAGQNFWGGRTFVAGAGPTELANHGTQRHLAFTRLDDAGFTEELAWHGADGAVLLTERRTVRARPVEADGVAAWALDLAVELAVAGERPVRIGSPATNGRPGAGYGGFFWRLPGTSTDIAVRVPGGEGEAAAHGSHADWVAVCGTTATGAGWTVAFAAADPRTAADAWFVRAREYPGVGSSLAWAEPVEVGPDDPLRRRHTVVVADGRCAPETAAALVAAAADAAAREARSSGREER